MKTKVCLTCGKKQTIDNFWKSSSYLRGRPRFKDGYNTQCYTCVWIKQQEKKQKEEKYTPTDMSRFDRFKKYRPWVKEQ